MTPNSRSYITQFSQPDPIIQDPYNPQDWNRYAYVRYNPISHNDPTGLDVDCGIGVGSLSDCKVQNSRSIDYVEKAIEKKFGVTMAEDGVKWAIDNLKTAFNALNMIDKKLRYHLKSLIGGTSFVLTGGGNMYYGWTHPDRVEFHVNNGNFKIPTINFLHETGHLLDNVPATADVFSGPLTNTTPNWVDAQGFVDESLLLGKMSQPVQAKYILNADGSSAEAFSPSEYWADSFANYIAGNINLTEPTGRGLDMSESVNTALRPYAIR